MPMLASPVVVGVKSAITTRSPANGPLRTPTPTPRELAVRAAQPPPTGTVALPLGAPLASIPTPLRAAGGADWPAEEGARGWGPRFNPHRPPAPGPGGGPPPRQ